MNENDLARLLPVPAERDLPADRKQILQEHLMTELRQADQPDHTSTKTRTRHPRRRPVLAAGAVLAAAAVAGAAVVGTNALSTPAARPKPPATAVTAAQLLVKIADAAARQPAPNPRDSDFTYIRDEVAYTTYFMNPDPSKIRAVMQPLHEAQVWLPVSNLCVTGLAIVNGERTPLSPFPVVNGKPRPTPPPGGTGPDITCPTEGNIGVPTYRFLQSLPTSPSALLAVLKAGKKQTNDDPPTLIGDLIRNTIVPPALSAALYRVAATLPGATLVPHATNAIGQPGIGIMWSGKSAKQVYKNEWIFDKTTLQFIGEKTYDPQTGKLNGESAILQRGFTAKAGQRP
jgi:hypothetical protein